MSIYHLSREELIRKIELDEQALKRAKSYKKEVEQLRKNLKQKTKPVIKEVVKTVEVPKEVIKEVVREVKVPVEVEKIIRVPYEVVKTEVVTKVKLPEGISEDHIKSFCKVRSLL